MSQTFDDIDSLILRLKAVARRVEADEVTSEPPEFAYRERLSELLQDHDDPLPISDPQQPRFGELLAPLHTDSVFLQRAYRILMGREADPDGFRAYLLQLPRTGRLYVLADLLYAEETRNYLARHDVTIPQRDRMILPLRIFVRLGPLKRLARPLLHFAYRRAERRLRPRLQLLERITLLETTRARNDALIRDVLLEFDGELNQRSQELHQQSQALHQQLQQRLNQHARGESALWSALQHQRRAVERLVDRPEKIPADTAPAILAQDLVDAYYLAFEEACRGSEAEITAHLRQYQPQLDTALSVGTRALDLGCGRGEWLALLAEQGFEPHGVDLNVAMIDHCRKAGFAVEHDDILTTLRRQPDNSHALVSAFHIAEHLPFDVLYAMVDEAQRILAPGGVLIVETPNPENVLVGSHTFYHDPTHRNPLTPTALSFLLTYHGFADVEVRRFNPYPEEAKVPGDDPLTERVNGHLCGPQDFAAIGTKAAPANLEESAEASA